MIDNYPALTLGRYMEINAVLQGDADDLDKQVQIIAILADKSVDEVLALPLGDYTNMAAKTAFLREPCPPLPIDKGWRYQGLVPTEDFTKITTAQYVDFQTFCKDFPATLPELLSVFLIPEGRKYNEGYDPAEVQDEVRALPFPAALGLAGFFFARYSESIADSLTFLEWGMTHTKDKMKRKALERKVREVRELLRSVGAGLQM